ncbi:hypothetical protein THAOC_13794 [Thalassiosira oceanica]|uniref:Uncharacterized protein n=1 Tax=Thalassiosira oceanica TaxID=159749 RepID=K0SGQ0_THAOC|nr:hypothetical protein THAOC_13794 [Thalassiosira oceanica]|eukprot:EJK65353.1 hypothetical protein THAOC_13794 [Thalassiosira oceanica]
MTFAHGDGKFCDCDECENDAVPDLIRDAAAAANTKAQSGAAVRVRPEQKHVHTANSDAGETRPRHLGVEGILGSKAEKESRRQVSWIEGASFLLPYSKGVATGWIHRAAQDVDGNEADQKDEKLDKNFTGKDGVEPIVFYAIKATSDAIKSLNDYMPTDVPPWIMAAHELLDGADEADTPFVHEIGGFVKSADETLKVSQVIDLAEGKT